MEITAQETAPAPIRTPEQEAILQTQKMQKELNLNKAQQQAIYEINLKNARERQISNSRTQALERTKNKNSAIKQVLTNDQFERLQNKRYERYPTGDDTYINRAVPQRQIQPTTENNKQSDAPKAAHTNIQQIQPTTELRSIKSVTNQISREIAPSSSPSTQVNPTVRRNQTLQPSRSKTIVRPPTVNSGDNEIPQRK